MIPYSINEDMTVRLLLASFALIAASASISDDALADLTANVAQDMATTVIRKILN